MQSTSETLPELAVAVSKNTPWSPPEVADDSGGEIAALLRQWTDNRASRPKGVQLRDRKATILISSVIGMVSRLCRQAVENGESRFPAARFLSEISDWWN